MTKDRIKKLLKIIFIGLVIIAAIKLIPYMKAESIQAWVDSYGALGPIIYILLWVFLPIVMFPITPLIVSGGILFGFWEGILYMLVGMFINSSIMFFISRKLFKDELKIYLMKKLPDTISSRLYLKDQKSLWTFYTILRFIPMISYSLISYSAGLTEMNYKNFITATMIGVLPSSLIYTNLALQALNPKSPGFLIAIGLTILLAVGSVILAVKFMPRPEKDRSKKTFKESLIEFKDYFINKIK